jgi:hypothetical protein
VKGKTDLYKAVSILFSIILVLFKRNGKYTFTFNVSKIYFHEFSLLAVISQSSRSPSPPPPLLRQPFSVICTLHVTGISKVCWKEMQIRTKETYSQ